MTLYHRCIAIVVILFAVLSAAPSGVAAQGASGWSGVRSNDGTIRPGSECLLSADDDATTYTLNSGAADVFLPNWTFNRAGDSGITNTTTIAAGATGSLTLSANSAVVANTLYRAYSSGSAVSGVILRANATASGVGGVSFTNTGTASYTSASGNLLVAASIVSSAYDNTLLHGAKRLAIQFKEASGSSMGGSVTVYFNDQFHQPKVNTFTVASTSYALTSHAVSEVTRIDYNITALAATDSIRIGLWGYGLNANASGINSQWLGTTSTTVSITDLTSTVGVWDNVYRTWYKHETAAVRRDGYTSGTLGIQAGDTYCWTWYSDLTSDSPSSVSITALPGAGATGLDNTGFGYTD